MATILKPLSSGTYTKGTGVLTFFPHVEPPAPGAVRHGGVRVGDCDSVAISISTTNSNRMSKEHNVPTVGVEFDDSIESKITINAAQLAPIVRAAAIMGDVGVFQQTARTDVTVELDNPGIHQVGAYNLVDIAVKKGALVAVEGTDYLIDPVSGQIETFFDGMSITFDAPEINTGFASGIASGSGIRGAFMFRSVNRQGVRSMLWIPDTRLRASGSREFISSGDVQITSLEGVIIPTADPDYPLGFERDITPETVGGI